MIMTILLFVFGYLLFCLAYGILENWFQAFENWMDERDRRKGKTWI